MLKEFSIFKDIIVEGNSSSNFDSTVLNSVELSRSQKKYNIDDIVKIGKWYRLEKEQNRFTKVKKYLFFNKVVPVKKIVSKIIKVKNVVDDWGSYYIVYDLEYKDGKIVRDCNSLIEFWDVDNVLIEELVGPPINRRYNDNDPYGEEEWEEEYILSESVDKREIRAKYAFLKDYAITYDKAEEAVIISKKLEELGFTVYPCKFKEWDEWNAITGGNRYDFSACSKDSYAHKNQINFIEFLNMLGGKYKRIENPDDPYNEEDWGYETIQESASDYEFLKNHRIDYTGVEEMQRIARRLTEIGFKVYNYGSILAGSDSDYYGYHWNDSDMSFNRTKRKSRDSISYDKFMELTASGKKYKTLSNKNFDPYNEEDWGFVQENISNYNLMECKLMYNHIIERVKIAKYLINLGFNVYDEEDVLDMDFPMGEWDCFTWDEDENCFVESDSKAFGSLRTVHFEDISDKKYKKVKNSELDPFEEEDWGYVQESLSEDDFRFPFEIGDPVIVNGIVDDEEFDNSHDVISDIAIDSLTTNMDENGECESYRYRGTSYYLAGCGWWVTPYNLKRYEINRNYTDEDPYGEENVNESLGDRFDKGDIVIYNGNQLYHRRDKKCEIISKCSEYNHSYNIKFLKDGLIHKCDVSLMSLHKKGEIKRVYTPDDPYGEEDWEDLEEGKKSTEKTLLDLKGKEFKTSLNPSIYSIMKKHNYRMGQDARDEIEALVKKIEGKKIMFTNIKDGKSIKKERISNGGFWVEDNNGRWSFYLVGTKKDYNVDILGKIGYYGDAPKITISPLDPYGEEDWD